MEPYNPAEHIYNWMMNDQMLYLRFKDMADYIKRHPTHINAMARGADALAVCTAEQAAKAGDFDYREWNQEVRRETGSMILREAEALSGVTIK